jgi:hypothetical protein
MHDTESISVKDELSHVFVLRQVRKFDFNGLHSVLKFGSQRRIQKSEIRTWHRVVLCAALGLALCAVLAQISTHETVAILDEDDGLNSDSSALNTDDGDATDGLDMKEASKRRLAAKAHASNKKKNIKRLSPSERVEVKKKVKMLKAEILKEIHNVSQADKQVIDKVAEIRTKLLHAKTVRRDGNDYESEAREVRNT